MVEITKSANSRANAISTFQINFTDGSYAVVRLARCRLDIDIPQNKIPTLILGFLLPPYFIPTHLLSRRRLDI